MTDKEKFIEFFNQFGIRLEEGWDVGSLQFVDDGVKVNKEYNLESILFDANGKFIQLRLET